MSGHGRNSVCWCGSGVKYKHCHLEFDEHLLSLQRNGYKIPLKRLVKNRQQIEGIKESGKINIQILDYIDKNIRPGMSTNEIDQMVYEKTLQLGGIPAPLNYEGFPKSVCVSINNVVCHGIPSDNVFLKEGDIVNVDVSTLFGGFYSDSSRMFCIGSVIPEARKLVEVAKQCVEIGISEVKPWTPIGNVGDAINCYAKQNQFSVVKEIGGHGIGLEFHEEPWVSYVSKRDTGILMVPGMVFTIEPMVNMGSSLVDIDRRDGWTVRTRDGSLSAQWECMVLVTEEGHEILAY